MIDPKTITKTVTIRVGSQTNPNAAAGSIAQAVRDLYAVEIATVGAGALNQAVKAVTIANSFLGTDGIVLVTVTAFEDRQIDQQVRTAIKTLALPMPLGLVTRVKERVTRTRQKLGTQRY